jgi:hypothetical protein
MTLVIGLTRHIAQQGKAVQMAMLKAADQRVNVMREIMEGAKVVKMQVWVGSL